MFAPQDSSTIVIVAVGPAILLIVEEAVAEHAAASVTVTDIPPAERLFSVIPEPAEEDQE